MSRLSLQLLGAFSVTVDGHPADRIDYDKARALLVYLAIEADRAHRRDHLAARFWPDQDRRHALQSLSQALYTLRRAIDDHHADPPFLTIGSRTLQFNEDADHWFDTQALTAALERCRTHAHADLHSCESCVQGLRTAVEHYGGDFLAGIDLDDCPEFGEWLAIQREHYRRLAGEQFRLLVDVYEARALPEPALDFAARWLALDPWQEEAHRTVIRVLAESGQPTAALAQYERCRQTLADELGVEPSVETETLVARIRRRRAGGNASSTNMPTMLTPLFGRKAELTTLQGILARQGCRFVSLVGPGGSGKTHLGIVAASEAAEHFADGAAFVALAGLDSPQGVVPAIAEAVGCSFSKDQDIRRQLIDYLRTRQLLLVLDNFEHLLAALPLITELLQAAQNVFVLATSRVRLNAPGEQVLVVGGLGLLESLPHEPADSLVAQTDDAAALFLHHARRLNADFEPNDEDRRAIGQICKQVAGMPLGILLAAAWSDVLPPVQIAQRLAEEPGEHETAGIDLLSVDWQALPERQRSMRSVLSHSWQLLDENDQRVFAGLSIFRGGFDADRARRVAGASLRRLKTFVEKSFLQLESDGRYAIHELLRQFGNEQLETVPALAEQTRVRHYRAYAESVAEWSIRLRSDEQLTALREFTAEIDNVRLAWRHAVEDKATGELAQMLDGLCLYYEWRSRYQVAVHALQEAIVELQEANDIAARVLLARLLVWLGRFNFILRNIDAAETTIAEALDLFDRLEHPGEDIGVVRAIALYHMGTVIEDGDRGGAERLWRNSQLLFRQMSESWWQCQVENKLGLLLLNLGRLEEAGALLEASLAKIRLTGDRRSTATILVTVAQFYQIQGQIEEAHSVIQESVDLYEELGDRRGAAQSRFELALTFMYLGRFVEAELLLQSTIEDAEALGDRGLHAIVLHVLGWNCTNRGQYTAAHHAYLTARVLLRSVESQRGFAMNDLGLGGNALALGRFVQAQRYLLESASGMRAIGQQDEYAIVLATLALVERALGRHDSAMAYVREALQIAKPIEAFAPARFAVQSYSLLIADAGQIEYGLELHTFVMQHPYFGNSVYRQDITGRHIDEYAATLAPEQRQRAKARGEARDLWATVDEVLAALGEPVTHTTG